MPHTSHKKKKKLQQQQQQKAQHLLSSNKRGEIKSDDGWTRIARSDKALSASNVTRKEFHEIMIFPPNDPDYRPDQDEGLTQMTHVCEPAQVPEGASLAKALSHYQKCNGSWKQSRTWAELKRTFDARMLEADLDITDCICFGLGSPTGLLTPTGADRRNVAMYQLAAFTSVRDILTEKCGGQRPQAFAQDPIFNALDVTLLARLDVDVVPHPRAFDLITLHTFAFCPGAEQSVLRGTLSRSPAMYMGSGALETYLDPHTGCLRSPHIGCIFIDDDHHHRNDSSAQERDLHERVEPQPQQQQQQHDDVKSPHGQIVPGVRAEAEVDAVRGARILHRFKEDKESFRLPDLEAHDYALYDTHLFWRSSGKDRQNNLK